MSEPTRELLLCAGALLDQGRTVDRLSRLLTAAALTTIMIGPMIATQPPWILLGSAVLVTLAGFAETYFAIRVGFDAALFNHVANSDASDFARNRRRAHAPRSSANHETRAPDRRTHRRRTAAV